MGARSLAGQFRGAGRARQLSGRSWVLSFRWFVSWSLLQQSGSVSEVIIHRPTISKQAGDVFVVRERAVWIGGRRVDRGFRWDNLRRR